MKLLFGSYIREDRVSFSVGMSVNTANLGYIFIVLDLGFWYIELRLGDVK